jgi:hypothetical protein
MGVTSCWWGGYHHEGNEEGVTTMMRKRSTSLGPAHPPWGLPLPLLQVSHFLILPFPHSCCPNIRLSLAKLCRIISSWFIHLEKCVVECPVDPFFRCPAGPRAWRSRRRAIRVTEHGGAAGCGAVYTILWSSSEPLRRLRQVNNYVDYMHLPRFSIGNVCAGT